MVPTEISTHIPIRFPHKLYAYLAPFSHNTQRGRQIDRQSDGNRPPLLCHRWPKRHRLVWKWWGEQSPKWLNADRTQYVRSSSGQITIVVTTLFSFLCETRMPFRLMLSSMPDAADAIAVTKMIFRQNVSRDLASCMMTVVRRCRSSSLTKWASRISRERFDLESPSFARTFCTNLDTGYDVTVFLRPELKKNRRSKNRRKWRFRYLQPKIAKYDIYINTDVLNSQTWYNVTGYFRLAVIEVKTRSRP